MKEFQFTTDVYRFHAALNRLCHGPNTWYNSGPAQKFILRQVKAMDYALVGPESRREHFAEKASYSARDEKGNCIVNDDMDIALLMLYAHMLYSGTSYPYALSEDAPSYPLLPLFFLAAKKNDFFPRSFGATKRVICLLTFHWGGKSFQTIFSAPMPSTPKTP